jgi:hypothetical protein
MKSERDTRSIQTAVRMPAWMVAKLKENPQGLSDELRRILQKEFDAQDHFDEATRQLGADVMELARLAVAQARVPWTVHPEAHALVASAIAAYLEAVGPPKSEPGVALPVTRLKPGRGAASGKALTLNFLQNRDAMRRKHEEILELEGKLERLRREVEAG